MRNSPSFSLVTPCFACVPGRMREGGGESDLKTENQPRMCTWRQGHLALRGFGPRLGVLLDEVGRVCGLVGGRHFFGVVCPWRLFRSFSLEEFFVSPCFLNPKP